MSEVLGYVDGFVGSYLNGWAAIQGQDRSCLVEVQDEDGIVLASGRATRQRDDLASMNFGRCDLGFRIPLTFGHGPALRVLVDGMELIGSPIAVGPDMFDGYFEIRGDVAAGWVSRRANVASAVAITLRLADGTLAGQAAAVCDEASEDPFFRPYRFEIPLLPDCIGRAEFSVGLFAEQTPVSTAAGGLAIDGYADVIAADHCSGWLVCPNAPRRSLEIVAYRDGQRIGSALCNHPRVDLRDRYPDQWHCGFMIHFDAQPAPPDALSEISLRLEGASTDLLGGPFLTGRRQAFLAAAKQIANTAHQPDTRLPPGARALFQDIMRNYLHARRGGADYAWVPGLSACAPQPGRSINVVVPVYKGVEITEACIRSVLETFGPQDRLILVSDAPPERDMADMIERYRSAERVVVLKNAANMGFIGSVNRALDFCRDGDVLMLNSDTRLFDGGLDEMRRVLHSAADIATVTAMSNSATIFSYPHPSLATAGLADVALDEIAQVALHANGDLAIEVPTGHGFCLLVRREVLDRLGRLNPAFGRGYGEENELCARATDLGYRHVAAAGTFVEHCESVSFGPEKAHLLGTNMPLLQAMYPEYTDTIMRYEARDDLRAARWKIDAHRLARTGMAGVRFVMTVENWLGGGTRKAVSDLGDMVGYGNRWLIRLSCTEDGMVHLDCARLRMKAVFAPDEQAPLIELLLAADIDRIVIHQLLGFGAGMIAALGAWARDRHAIFYAHDFYAICPRTTLIDAVQSYCAVADATVCARCVRLGGAHEASRLAELTPQAHRRLFADFLGAMTTIVAPSRDTAAHLHRAMPDLRIEAIGHPARPEQYPTAMRAGSRTNIVLLGAIGPHKGSAKLLEIASYALMTHPQLTFTVIGHTDIDAQLKKLGNVVITGAYRQSQLRALLAETGSSICLFLHGWPETFSYTLSEAVQAGMLPVVPDIGAPAERVRDAGFGIVFPFPIDTRQVLSVLAQLAEAPPTASTIGTPKDFATAQSLAILKQMLA